MSWVRVWIHLVFTTKDKEKILSEKIRKEVFMHIKTNAKQKEIKIDCVNGYLEHVHCLFLLNKEQTISKSVGLIKGESSY
ncbi:MAG TPA: transposase [Ignavibacteriaceae bacterium]|jgi:REP element-mobilizing transposase RayT